MNKTPSLSSYLFGWFSIIFGSFTLNDWAVIVGMLATILGFIVTWTYKHFEFKLKKQQLKKDNKVKKKPT